MSAFLMSPLEAIHFEENWGKHGFRVNLTTVRSSKLAQNQGLGKYTKGYDGKSDRITKADKQRGVKLLINCATIIL